MKTASAGMDHVLVATDLSENAKPAVRLAAELAGRFGARLTLLHSIDPSAFVPPMVSVTRAQELERSIEQDLRKATAKTLLDLQETYLHGIDGVKCETIVGLSTADAICSYAKRHGVDWLVVGTHGRTGLKHMLIGSVAERVVRHAPCTVVVARSLEDDSAGS